MRKYRGGNLRDGLVGAWCPSVAGNGLLLPDLSGYGNHGTLTNMDASDWVGADRGRALDFDGVDDYASCLKTHYKNAITLVAFADNISSSLYNFPYILDLSSNSMLPGPVGGFVVAGIGTNVDSTNARWVLLQGNNDSICDLSVAIPANRLNCWIGTWDGATANFYLNGDLAASTTSNKVLSTSAERLYIGLLRSAVRYLRGRIHDVRMFDRALSASEVKQLYEGGPGFGLRVERKRTRFQVQGFNAGRFRRQQLIGTGVY